MESVQSVRTLSFVCVHQGAPPFGGRGSHLYAFRVRFLLVRFWRRVRWVMAFSATPFTSRSDSAIIPSRTVSRARFRHRFDGRGGIPIPPGSRAGVAPLLAPSYFVSEARS